MNNRAEGILIIWGLTTASPLHETRDGGVCVTTTLSCFAEREGIPSLSSGTTTLA